MSLTKVTFSMIKQGFANPLDYGAVGDGTTDDTTAITTAIATGLDVYVPLGYTFAITGNVTGFANSQRIFGGGTFKKLGTTQVPLFLLPDESENVWFDGVQFDGTSASFSAGNPVPAILGYITHSLKVTGCYFYNIIDVGIKLRDGANLYAAGNTFYNIGENGIELHNYTVDPRTGSQYTGTRPVIEGNHTIIGNRFEKITRYENPAGPLVDANAILFVGTTGYRQQNIRIESNVIIDCLRGIWTENNPTNSEAINVVIHGNTLQGGVNGGTAQNIYGKYGIGIVGVLNGVVSNNTIRNIANTNPVGTETACIIISGQKNELIEISGNICADDSGLADRTEWGIYCLIANGIRIHDNIVSGTSNAAGIYLNSTFTVSSVVYANYGNNAAYSWNQIIPIIFSLANIPANATTFLLPFGNSPDNGFILPSGGRIVAISAKLSEAFTAGTISVATAINGTTQTNLTMVNADFVSQAKGYKEISTTNGTQFQPLDEIKVTVTTDAAFLPITSDLQVVLYIDIGIKF